MDKKLTDMERLRYIQTHRGPLDYSEFVVDPENSMSDNAQIGEVLGAYFEDLGISRDEWRKWLLDRMREAREAKTQSLTRSIEWKKIDSPQSQS